MGERNVKNSFFQVGRGICICAVVMIHCPTASVNEAYFYPWFLTRSLINFPVSIFIFLAGYFSNEDKISQNVCEYYKLRGGVRLLIPFLVWSSFYSLLSVADDLFKGASIDWMFIIKRFLTGNSSTPLYYILVLLQLVLLTPLLFRLHQNKVAHFLLYLISPLHVLSIYFFNLRYGYQLPGYETLFTAWLLFYILGIDCRSGEFSIVISRTRWWHVLIGLLLSISESFLLVRLNGTVANFTFSQIRLGNYIYCIAIIMWLLRNKTNENIKCTVLKHLGDYSFGIYFIHPFFLLCLGRVFQRFSLNEISWPVLFMLMFVLCLSISYASIRVIEFILVKINRCIVQLLGIR